MLFESLFFFGQHKIIIEGTLRLYQEARGSSALEIHIMGSEQDVGLLKVSRGEYLDPHHSIHPLIKFGTALPKLASNVSTKL